MKKIILFAFLLTAGLYAGNRSQFSKVDISDQSLFQVISGTQIYTNDLMLYTTYQIYTPRIILDGKSGNIKANNLDIGFGLLDRLYNIGLSTAGLRTDLTTESNNRISGDTALGISTGILRTDLILIQNSTGYLQNKFDTLQEWATCYSAINISSQSIVNYSINSGTAVYSQNSDMLDGQHINYYAVYNNVQITTTTIRTDLTAEISSRTLLTGHLASTQTWTAHQNVYGYINSYAGLNMHDKDLVGVATGYFYNVNIGTGNFYKLSGGIIEANILTDNITFPNEHLIHSITNENGKFIVVENSTNNFSGISIMNSNSGQNAMPVLRLTNNADKGMMMIVTSSNSIDPPPNMGVILADELTNGIAINTSTGTIKFYSGDVADPQMEIKEKEILISSGNLIFNENNKSTIGQYQANRPYKIYVSSEIIIGNSIKISGDEIRHSGMIDPIISVSTNMIVNMAVKTKIKELEIDTPGLKSNGRIKSIQDIEVNGDNRGLILTALNGYKFLIWVDNTGSLFTTQISASPEISYEERVIRLTADREKKAEQKREYKNIPKANLKERLDIIEQILNIQ